MRDIVGHTMHVKSLTEPPPFAGIIAQARILFRARETSKAEKSPDASFTMSFSQQALDGSWGLLGAVLGLLGASRKRLGASWKPIGGVLEPLGCLGAAYHPRQKSYRQLKIVLGTYFPVTVTADHARSN